MNTVLVGALMIVVCAIVLLFLLLVAALFAAAMFHFVPKLQGTVLALTGSDISQALRRMPTYPSWWHRRDSQSHKPEFVFLALNDRGQTEYMYAFDPLHHPLFQPDRSAALRLDSKDKFLIERLILRAQDNKLDVFLAPAAEKECPETKIGRPGRGRTYLGLVPPREIYQNRMPHLVVRDVRPEAFLGVSRLQSTQHARKFSY